MRVTHYLKFMLSGVLVLGYGRPSSASDPIRLPVSFPSATSRPEVVVYVVSPTTSFLSSIKKADLDDMIERSQIDIVLVVPSGNTHGANAVALAKIIADVEFGQESSEERPSTDLRYRVDLRDDGTTLFKLYSTPFGVVVFNDVIYVPKKGTWLASFFAELTGRLVLEKPRPR